ncbi:MAG: glycosyltransferase family 4 protein [Isosphaeraceae bacterium]
MKVVIVAGCLPYPANTGARIRTLHLLKRMAGRHALTLLAPRVADRDSAREAVEYLGDHGIEAVEVEHSVPRKAGPGFYLRLAGNLASPLPYSVAAYHGPAVSRAVERLARRGDVDLWQAEWLAGFEALRRVPDAAILVHAHNVETLIWERYVSTESHPLKRWYVRGQCRKFEQFERRAFHGSSRVVCVSPEDAALARSRFGLPADRVDVVDNGIDRAFFEATPAAERDPRRVLFLGSLDWRPNLDALDLLLGRVFPALRAAEPGATLDVVGRNPPAALARRVDETPGAVLHANVADVRPYLARAGVLAVPLRVGGGSRLKILEALASGLPVVSTRVGAEGLCLTPDEDLVVTGDDADSFTRGLIDAVRVPARVQATAARGRAFVLRRYDWDVLADDLERSWERCAAVRTAGGRL